MLIQPKVRGFICTAAHPVGCFKAVEEQVNYVLSKGPIKNGPKNVLIIGASTGYGLASRIVSAFGAHANTIGVSFERPTDGKRTASPGWYNTAAFEQLARKSGYFSQSINGDAFSNEIKKEVLELIKKQGHPIDLLIYSLAAPKRIHPVTGEVYSSVLKPLNSQYHNKTVDPISGVVKEISIDPATPLELEQTIKVMGGEDWSLWVDQLLSEGLFEKHAMTMAYSYIGPELTHPIYKNGTIGKAKEHLNRTAQALNEKMAAIGGRALISINKALVTQASSAIPVVPLYISLLYKIMKQRGTHEGCIQQMDRLFRDHLYAVNGPITDDSGVIRVDDWEMNPEIQNEISQLWPMINNENLESLTDIQGYRHDFYRLFGFEFPEIDYSKEVEP